MASDAQNKSAVAAAEVKPKLVKVTYMGLKRIEHSQTGKIFGYGTTHTLSEEQWDNLYRSTAGEPFEVE